MDVEHVALGAVTPFPGNPRRGDIEAIRKSVRRFGQQRPVLVQRSTRQIVAGNHLYQAIVAEQAEYAADTEAGGATKARSFDGVDVVWTDLTDVEARAYLVADNQLSARGQNDPDAMAAWLADLASEGAIDDALGFDSEELDRFLAAAERPSDSEGDFVPELPVDPWVKPGDLFTLGDHRLYVGDATQAESYQRLLGDEQVQLVWTDPPYGVEVMGRTADHLTIANDESDEVALRALLESSLGHAVARLARGRGIYVCGPGGAMARTFLDVLIDLRVYRQTIVWVKDLFVMGRSDYHYRHEQMFAGAAPKGKPKEVREAQPIHYGWRPGASHFFITDRTLDTVWEVDRPKRSTEHPTMKPVELVERSILASTTRGELILDPFAGSGTTLVAAERTKRRAAIMELDPRYAQVCIDRWVALTGGTPEQVAQTAAA